MMTVIDKLLDIESSQKVSTVSSSVNVLLTKGGPSTNMNSSIVNISSATYDETYIVTSFTAATLLF